MLNLSNRKVQDDQKVKVKFILAMTTFYLQTFLYRKLERERYLQLILFKILIFKPVIFKYKLIIFQKSRVYFFIIVICYVRNVIFCTN